MYTTLGEKFLENIGAKGYKRAKVEFALEYHPDRQKGHS